MVHNREEHSALVPPEDERFNQIWFERLPYPSLEVVLPMKSKLLQRKNCGLNHSREVVDCQQQHIDESSVPGRVRENPPGRNGPTTGVKARKDFSLSSRTLADGNTGCGEGARLLFH